MFHRNALLVLALALGTGAAAQAPARIRVDQYALPNGLKVQLVEDHSSQVVAVDLNRDRRPDLVALGSQMPELVWYENPTWERHVITTGAPRMINADAADTDGDGIPEIALAYEFSKGYYARVSDRMYGRVARLLVTPLVRSLIRILGHHPLLTYLDNFRYPLSGEFAMSIDLANAIRVPGDWGLEIGILAEVYRNTTTKRICQIDLVDRYDHKHQILSRASARRGRGGLRTPRRASGPCAGDSR